MVSCGGCISVECVVGWCEMGMWCDGVGDRGEVDEESDDMNVVDICCCVGIS